MFLEVLEIRERSFDLSIWLTTTAKTRRGKGMRHRTESSTRLCQYLGLAMLSGLASVCQDY
jgi:hypothetical protein